MRPGWRHPGADELAAYSIGGLAGREQRAVERHLRRCRGCAQALAERFAPAVAVLAESVEQHEPPPELRQSLLAAVQQEAAAAPQAERGDGERDRRATGLAAVLLRPAAGVAALSLLVAAGIGYLVAGGEEKPAETIALPEASSGMGGELVVEDGSATLRMHGVEPLGDSGAVYQVWVADPDGVVPSATFVPHADGTATAAVPEAAGDATEVMITREPRPGRTSPSGEPIVDLRLD